MADETPSLQIDNDWKKQAQEEKRRLAEQEKQRGQSAGGATPPSPGTPASSGSTPTDPRAAANPRAAGGSAAAQAGRELPAASFQTMVQSIVTQALYHLGELAVRGGEPVVNLDMAKHHIDTLEVLEQKTANNLSEDEQKMLNSALYEARMRFVSVASQYIS